MVGAGAGAGGAIGIGNERWRRIRVLSALACAAFGIVVVAQAMLPGAPYLPEGVEFVPFLTAFPLFAWSVIERAGSRTTPRGARTRKGWLQGTMVSDADANRAWSDLGAFARRHWLVISAGIPVFITLWGIGLYSIASNNGQPEHVGNSYYLDDHGSRIPVTKAGYERAVAMQQAAFASGGTMFLFVSAGLTLTFELSKRRQG